MSDNQTPKGNEDESQEILEEAEETAQQTTEESEDDTQIKPEDETEEVNYQEKFTLSQKEAIRLHKENKKLQEEAAYAKKLSKVSRNKEYLQEINEEDPDLAERIAQDLFEESYSEVFDDSPETDHRKIVRDELKRQESKREKEAIEDYEVEFFEKNGIIPGSEEYKKIMNVYHDYEPNTLKKAKGLLSMALKSQTDIKEYEETHAPNTSFGGQPTQAEKSSKSEKEIYDFMKSQGVTISQKALKKAKEAGII